MRNLFLLPAAVAFKRGARVLPRVRGGALSSTATAQHFIDDVNAQYEALHTDFEAQFWGTKMALSTDHEPLSGPKREYSVAELTKTKQAMEAFLGDEAKLEARHTQCLGELVGLIRDLDWAALLAALTPEAVYMNGEELAPCGEVTWHAENRFTPAPRGRTLVQHIEWICDGLSLIHI